MTLLETANSSNGQYNLNTIQFNKPFRSSNEERYLKMALEEGLSSRDGQFYKACRTILQNTIGHGDVFLTTSCSTALELAVLAADISYGDEVILPSLTFTSTANAVVLRGATPVFVDIDKDTYNIDPSGIEEAITSKTRALIVVHYGGVVCDMERIANIAKKHDLLVIEDAAQAICSSRGGRQAGSFGDLAAVSFHSSKNISCGEGGCLIVNNRQLAPRIENHFEKGTNRRDFNCGLVDKYTWIDVGSSFILSELNCAVLCSQLEERDLICTSRRRVWRTYEKYFLSLDRKNGFTSREIPKECEHNAHIFSLLLDTTDERAAFISSMKECGITTPFHYIPLHSSPAGKNYGRTVGSMYNTDSISSRMVRLPVYPDLGSGADLTLEAIELWTRQRRAR